MKASHYTSLYKRRFMQQVLRIDWQQQYDACK